MEKRNITITLEKAVEWYNSGNDSLKEIALQAFSRDELLYNYRNIKYLSDACEVPGFDYVGIITIALSIAKFSKSSAAMFKLNIIRKALNLGQDLHLTKNPEDSCIYYPYNPFATESSTYYESELISGRMEVIGKVKSEGTLYNVLGGGVGCSSGSGFGCFRSFGSAGFTDAVVGFLGCASEEIAKHFSKYFGMLITEAKYADIVDFEIVGEK